ncbi:S1-like domain-containing RNA-binding protein [Streptococcus thoraltensis]
MKRINNMRIIKVTDTSIFVSNNEGSFLELPKENLDFELQVGDEVKLNDTGDKLIKVSSDHNIYNKDSKNVQNNILNRLKKLDFISKVNFLTIVLAAILISFLLFVSNEYSLLTNIAICMFLIGILVSLVNLVLSLFFLFKKQKKRITKTLLFLVGAMLCTVFSIWLYTYSPNLNNNEVSHGVANSSDIEPDSSDVVDTDKKNYKTIDYNKWNHDDEDVAYSDKVLVKGKVVQSIADGKDGQIIRIAQNDDYDTIVYGYIDSEDYNDVIAEDDDIAVYGSANGLISYDTTLKSEITIPYMDIYFYDINEKILEEESKNFEKNTLFNQDGILFEQITNDTFEVRNNSSQEISISVDSLDVNGKVVDEFNLVDLYGDLKPGQHKTVKLRDTDNIMKKGATVNFTIDIDDTNYETISSFDASIVLKEDIVSKY